MTLDIINLRGKAVVGSVRARGGLLCGRTKKIPDTGMIGARNWWRRELNLMEPGLGCFLHHAQGDEEKVEQTGDGEHGNSLSLSG